MTFFSVFINLCSEKHVSPTRAAADMGFSNSTTTKWSKGAFPSGKSLQKVAQYFGVTVDRLLAQCTEKNVASDGNIKSRDSAEDETGSGEVRNEQEAELLRIFRALDMKEKISMLYAAYALEERHSK